jgi:hypothetical protein
MKWKGGELVSERHRHERKTNGAQEYARQMMGGYKGATGGTLWQG